MHHGQSYLNFDTIIEKETINRQMNSYGQSRRGEREIEARDEWEAQYVA
jgi:PadR family transcriptional regulator PadR